MILSFWRIFRSLAWHHHAMIFITILLPFLWAWFSTHWIPEHFGPTPIHHGAALLVFWLFASVSVALVLRRDRSKAERFVSREVETVWDEVRAVRVQHDNLLAQHGDLIEDLSRQIREQDEIFRSGFERLGHVVSGRSISVSPRPVSFHFTVPNAVGNVTGGTKWRRLLRFLRRSGCRLRQTVWGKPDHD